MKKLIAFIILLCAAGCIHQRGGPSIEPPVVRETYEYQLIKPHSYIVVARDYPSYEAAKRELGCGICIESNKGLLFMWTVEVHEKEKK